jgi:uncharacterized protein (DUF2267 family)
MTSNENENLLSRVKETLAVSYEEARRITAETLRALAEALEEEDAREIAGVLSGDLAQHFRIVERQRPMPLDRFYSQVAERLEMQKGRAIETAQSVCAALAERLSPPLVQRLQQLPDYGDLFVLRSFPEAPRQADVIRAPHAPRHTLAEGRPGSAHPLSEARPEKAHSHSVALNPDPHGDTKLSGSRGLTQERLGETLASGRPGSKRPI